VRRNSDGILSITPFLRWLHPSRKMLDKSYTNTDLLVFIGMRVNISHLRLALSKGPNRVGVSLPSPKHPVSETSCSLVIQNSGRWTKPTIPAILNLLSSPMLPASQILSSWSLIYVMWTYCLTIDAVLFVAQFTALIRRYWCNGMPVSHLLLSVRVFVICLETNVLTTGFNGPVITIRPKVRRQFLTAAMILLDCIKRTWQ
jgi:hypothetical protein